MKSSRLIKYSPDASPRSGTLYTAQFAPAIDCVPGEASLPLGEYLEIVRRQLWKILLFVVASTVATYFVSLHLKPTYRAVAVIDIDRSAPSGVVGEDPSRPTDINDADDFLLTQVRLIQSNAVVRPVAEKYRLFQRTKDVEHSKQPGFEHRVRPIELSGLKVKRQPSTYLILISYDSHDPVLAADVANAVASSYIQCTLDVRARSSAGLSSFMEKQLDELKAKMERSEQALAKFKSEFDVIDPAQKTNILSSRLLQLNTEYTAAQVDRVRKESTYNSILSGSLEAAQLSGQGEELGKLVDQLNEVTQHFAEVKTTYGSNHPEYQKAASRLTELQDQVIQTRKNIFNRVALDYKGAIAREKMLRKAVAETKAEFDRLNSKSFEYQTLLQEAIANKKLYEELVEKTKEAGINMGFRNTNIRIADLALPPVRPVFPNTGLNLAGAFILSSLLGAVIAVVAEKTNTRVRSADETSRQLDTRVIGTLPFAKELAQTSVFHYPGTLKTSARPASSDGSLAVEQTESPRMSAFEESVRTLRNCIVLSNVTQNVNSVLITSPGAGEGKTTTAVHLAIAHSAQRRRTLLVDADLRRGSVHKHLNISSKIGLSDVLTGDHTWREARISMPQYPHLDVILAGTPPYSAADLIGPMLNDLLDEFAKEYELVLLDGAPFLGFAEALHAAAAVSGVVIVATSGKTPRKALEQTLTSLSWLRANVLGVVLNRTHDTTQPNYGYAAYYRDGAHRRGILKSRADRLSQQS